MTMVRWIAMLLTLCLLMPVSVLGEETAVVKFKRLTVPVNAQEIDLGKNTVSNSEYKSFYAFLSKLPELKKVDMYATRIPARRINELTAKFPDVEFGWTMAVGDHSVRTDITAFSTRHSDRAGRHKNEDFQLLKYCKNLQALDIGHNAVTDLSFLYDLPKLKVLIVVDNYFQDITPIASLKDLEYLEIFYNDVRDISALTRLTKLIDLNICFNRIKDISPLKEMTFLKRLWLSQYNSHNPTKKPDPAAVDEIRAALTNTLIDSTAKSSVENGWRDHPHYAIVREMFKTQTYIPFEDSWHNQ